jgi:hypothetical protein
MEADFCLEAVEEALARHGKPSVFNTDSKNDGAGNLDDPVVSGGDLPEDRRRSEVVPVALTLTRNSHTDE